MPPPLWLLLAVSLLLLSLLGLDSDGLLLLSGCVALLLSLLTNLLPLAGGVQVLVGLALLAAGYAALRRWAGRSHERTIPPAGNADNAEVIVAFDAAGRGRVLWKGQSWAAETLAPTQALAPGARVTVMGREGTRLQVLPAAPQAESAPPVSRKTTG
jgi:membrane protein implicated in regulation of membrane protease activity